MTRRVFEKLCTEKVCVDFLAPILGMETLNVDSHSDSREVETWIRAENGP